MYPIAAVELSNDYAPEELSSLRLLRVLSKNTFARVTTKARVETLSLPPSQQWLYKRGGVRCKENRQGEETKVPTQQASAGDECPGLQGILREAGGCAGRRRSDSAEGTADPTPAIKESARTE